MAITAVLELLHSPKSFHAKSEWQKSPEFSTLWHLNLKSSGNKFWLCLSYFRNTEQSNDDTSKLQQTKPKQRNYKNMTRERRIEANARERQRVQAITEVYETLRKVIPVEDNCSKLSKLSIIRIATGYIMLLSRQCGMDYSSDQSNPSVEECQKRLANLIRCEKNGQDWFCSI